jgi:hypothetical protein
VTRCNLIPTGNEVQRALLTRAIIPAQQKKFDSADWAKNLKKPKAGSAKQPAEGQLEQHE